MEKRFLGFPKKEKEPNRCKKTEDNTQNNIIVRIRRDDELIMTQKNT